MGLPNIGPLELIIILAIALLIVGPGRLPGMGKAIGDTIREFRRASSDMSDATSDKPDESTPDQPEPNALSAQSEPNQVAQPAEPASSDEPSAGEQADEAKPS